MRYIYFLVQFSSQFCIYLALKLRWSAIKVGSALVDTTLSGLSRKNTFLPRKKSGEDLFFSFGERNFCPKYECKNSEDLFGERTFLAKN